MGAQIQSHTTELVERRGGCGRQERVRENFPKAVAFELVSRD